MIRVLGILTAAIVAVAALGGFVAFRRPTPGDAVEVSIPEGSSTVAIAELLADQQVIGSVLGFRLMSRVRGLDGEIRAGNYELNRGMGVHAALDVLGGGPVQRSISVTIPEGFTVRKVAERLGERTHLEADDVLAAAGSGDVRPEALPEDVDSLEGFLFPDTYAVFPKETAVDVLRRMVSQFDERTSELDWSFAASRGLSRYEAVIIASLVEREAKVPEDRPKVAAVVYNRLAKGMRLQIDITALYGREHKVPTRRDLRQESPYNTYVIDGLPPTPIANPGLESIRAALDPADIDALYYVVVEESGRHAFTADYNEFQRLKQRRPAEVRGG